MFPGFGVLKLRQGNRPPGVKEPDLIERGLTQFQRNWSIWQSGRRVWWAELQDCQHYGKSNSHVKVGLSLFAMAWVYEPWHYLSGQSRANEYVQMNHKDLRTVRIKKRIVREGMEWKETLLHLRSWLLLFSIWFRGLQHLRRTWCQVGPSSAVKYAPEFPRLVIWRWRQWSGVPGRVLFMSLTSAKASEWDSSCL